MGEPFEVAAIVERVRTDGYAICEGVLDAERVAAVHAELDAILEATPTGRNPTPTSSLISRRWPGIWCTCRPTSTSGWAGTTTPP